jgi:hypothetical protein
MLIGRSPIGVGAADLAEPREELLWYGYMMVLFPETGLLNYPRCSSSLSWDSVSSLPVEDSPKRIPGGRPQVLRAVAVADMISRCARPEERLVLKL